MFMNFILCFKSIFKFSRVSIISLTKKKKKIEKVALVSLTLFENKVYNSNEQPPSSIFSLSFSSIYDSALSYFISFKSLRVYA